MQDMGSSICPRVLEQHSDEIQYAIQSELSGLVDKLVDEGIVEVPIRNRVFEDPTTVLDTAGNARRLLTVIKGKVRQNHAHFKTFVGVLKESNLTELAVKLEKAHDRLQHMQRAKSLTMLTAVIAVIVGVCMYVYLRPVPPPPLLCAHLELKNGYISLNAVTEGEIATFICQEGYILKGEETLTCEPSGQWSGDVPKCISVDCGPPPQIQGGSVQCDDTSFNGIAEYNCNEGFLLVGTSTVVCQSDGRTAMWSATKPSCEPIKCPELEKPMNGRIEAKRQTFGAKAEYSCNRGFDLTGGNQVRECLAAGSWSGKAPSCQFDPKREDKVAYSIQIKTNRLQEIAWSLKGQNTVAQALEVISSNLAEGKLQVGMVGLMKSGKSSVLNALLRGVVLPVTVQAETAIEVRIIHSTKGEHKRGVLFGEKYNEKIAVGNDEIEETLRKFNKIARNESREEQMLPYKFVTLRTPFHFLDEKKLKFTLQISDTAGPNEAGAFETSLSSKQAMERLSAFIIVLNYRIMKDQAEMDLLTHLRNHHPHLLENHQRFLFIVNAIDAYYEDGNKYATPPQDVPKYVQDYLKQILEVNIPLERIVPFTAKWALKSQMWSENYTNMTDGEYFDAMRLYSKFQGEDPQKQLRVPSDLNKQMVVDGLKFFSRVGELEAKLYQMLGVNGPEILYKGAIDDAVQHVSDLEEYIEKEKENCNLGATQTALKLHEDLLREIGDAIAANKQRRPRIQTEVERKITIEVNDWTFELTDSMYSQMNSLLEELNKQNLESQILKPARDKMENFWPTIMAKIIGMVKEETNKMLSVFKQDLEERLSRFEGVELQFDELEYTDVDPKSPPFVLFFSIPPDLDLHDTSALKDKLWDLAVDWAVQFQGKVKAEAAKLSISTSGKAERAAQKSISRFRRNVLEEIRCLRSELATKQGIIETLNQKLGELQTISEQLQGAQSKIKSSLLDEIPTFFSE